MLQKALLLMDVFIIVTHKTLELNFENEFKKFTPKKAGNSNEIVGEITDNLQSPILGNYVAMDIFNHSIS